YFNAAHAVDDARRVLQAGQQRMPPAGGRVALQAQIRILHWTFDAAFECNAEQIRQAEVLSLYTPFVVETGLVGADEAPAATDELAELPTLPVRKCGDIRQDERLEPSEMRVVEQPVMHHLKWDARFNERLIPAERVVFDLCAVKPCGLLGIDQADASQ